MKLSNKLLIILGIVVFMLPLGIVVAVNSGGVNKNEYIHSLEEESKSFAAETKHLSGNALKAYKSITIKSEGPQDLILHLVQDSQYGFKSTYALPDVEVVDAANGETILHFKNPSWQSAHVYLYAPDFEHISLENFNLSKLSTREDSLKLDVINSPWSFNVADNESLKSMDITLQGSKIENVNFGELEQLNLSLINSEIKMESKSYKKLALNLNNAKFVMEGENNVNPTFSQLSVLSKGQSYINFPKKTIVQNIDGNLSDSTIMVVPAFLLKNLIK